MAEAKKEALKTMDAKGMLKELGAKKTKIKYGERMTVEILEDTKYYRQGQVIKPHTVIAKQLIKDKIAKAV